MDMTMPSEKDPNRQRHTDDSIPSEDQILETMNIWGKASAVPKKKQKATERLATSVQRRKDAKSSPSTRTRPELSFL
jgi:hypothetical protein